MTANEGLRIFKSKYPDKKLRGYWDHGNEIVVCIESEMAGILREPVLFIVKPDGSIIPTDPIKGRISIETMVAL